MIPLYDVVVVGAGPVGLATALGLRERGITSVAVIEKARTFRKVGQVIGLAPNGFRALKRTSWKTYNKLCEIADARGGAAVPTPPKGGGRAEAWTARNFQGELKGSVDLSFEAYKDKYGEGRMSVGWWELQTHLREMLPEDVVLPNHRCLQVVKESDSGLVRVEFTSASESAGENGSEPQLYAHWEKKMNLNMRETIGSGVDEDAAESSTGAFRARILVGADGIKSAVRQSMLQGGPHDAFALPEYSGFAGIGCECAEDIPEDLWNELDSRFLGGAKAVTVRAFEDESCEGNGILEGKIEGIPRLVVFSQKSRRCSLLFHDVIPLDNLRNRPQDVWVEIMCKILEEAHFPDVLIRLARCARVDTVYVRPYYIHRVTNSSQLPLPKTAITNKTDGTITEPPWSAGRIVLVGDAAHGMPPFAAQGANQGMEDAAALTSFIAGLAEKHGLDDVRAMEAAFKEYENSRRPRVLDAQCGTIGHVFYGSERRTQDFLDRMYLSHDN